MKTVFASWGLVATLGLSALPAAAGYITTDRTVANGYPLNGNYNGQTLLLGLVSNAGVRVPNLQADVLDPGQFSYNDQTGGGLLAFSNSLVRVQGGVFGQTSSNGFGGGLHLNDTSHGLISGGTLQLLNVQGAAAGANGALAEVSGGLIQNGVAGVAIVANGRLNVTGGTIRASGNGYQSAVVGDAGSVITVSGGLMQSVSGAAIRISGGSVLDMAGGTATGGPNGGAQRGVDIDHASVAALLHGGTINGGIRATRYAYAASLPAVQAVLGGQIVVNGGSFAYADAAIDVFGGSFSPFAGGDASFFAMGSNTINFFGSGLTLSGPTAGSVFDYNTYVGNYYSFTGGTFRDGQSAVGVRLFDALSINGQSTGFGGGFTLTSAVPEPAPFGLMLLALPWLGWVARRRQAGMAHPG